MKEKVQDRINKMRQLATSPGKGHGVKNAEPYRSNDSLSKSIRNSKEAAIFLEELKAAVRIASLKKN
jgi:hypothetical protein